MEKTVLLLTNPKINYLAHFTIVLENPCDLVRQMIVFFTAGLGGRNMWELAGKWKDQWIHYIAQWFSGWMLFIHSWSDIIYLASGYCLKSLQVRLFWYIFPFHLWYWKTIVWNIYLQASIRRVKNLLAIPKFGTSSSHFPSNLTN